MHHEITTLLTLLMIATSVAMLVRYINLPYTVMLVLGGLLLGLLHYLPEVQMSPEVVMTIFLPILLFEAAINLEYSHLRSDLKPILTFAVPGVLISLLITGACMHYGAGFPWAIALLFGSLIVATDPVSVLAIFKKLGVPPRLTALVEGESLFNDGTAVVAFQIVLAMVVTGNFSVMASVQKFLFVCFGGLATGLILSYAAIVLLEKFDDHLLELMITTVLAYSAYLVAEHFHVSGVIAVVSAGIMMGNLGWAKAMTPTTRVAISTFWEFAAFIINSLIFLLIGLQIHLEYLVEFLPTIGIGIVALFAGRMLSIYPLAGLLNVMNAKIPFKWTHILVWGNLKGALSMALVMSLPENVPYRRELLITIFGVVLFSLLVQGVTMGRFLGFLGIGKKNEIVEAFEAQRGTLLGLRSGLSSLEQMYAQGKVGATLYQEKKSTYAASIEAAENTITAMMNSHKELATLQSNSVRRHLLIAQKSSYREAFRSGLLSESTAHDLIRNVNNELEAMEQSEEGH